MYSCASNAVCSFVQFFLYGIKASRDTMIAESVVTSIWKRYNTMVNHVCKYLCIRIGVTHSIEGIFSKLFPLGLLNKIGFNSISTKEIQFCVSCHHQRDTSTVANKFPSRQFMVSQSSNIL